MTTKSTINVSENQPGMSNILEAKSQMSAGLASLDKLLERVISLCDAQAPLYFTIARLNIPNDFELKKKVNKASPLLVTTLPIDKIPASYSGNILDKIDMKDIVEIRSTRPLELHLSDEILKPEAAKQHVETLLQIKKEATNVKQNIANLGHKIGQMSTGAYDLSQDVLKTIAAQVEELNTRNNALHIEITQGLKQSLGSYELETKKLLTELKSNHAFLSDNYEAIGKALSTIKSEFEPLKSALADNARSVNSSTDHSYSAVKTQLQQVENHLNKIERIHIETRKESEALLSGEMARIQKIMREKDTTKNTFFTSMLPGEIESFAFYTTGDDDQLIHQPDATVDDILSRMTYAFYHNNHVDRLRKQEIQLRFFGGKTTSILDLANVEYEPVATSKDNVDLVYFGVYTNNPESSTSFRYTASGLEKITSKLNNKRLDVDELQTHMLKGKINTPDFESSSVGISLRPNFGNIYLGPSISTPFADDIALSKPASLMQVGWHVARDLTRDINFDPNSIKTAVFVERKTTDGASYMFLLANKPKQQYDGKIVNIGNLVTLE
jgi:hypothetical protein